MGLNSACKAWLNQSEVKWRWQILDSNPRVQCRVQYDTCLASLNDPNPNPKSI